MEQDKFIQRLQELAEITAIKIPIGPKYRQSKDGEVVYRQGQEIRLDPKANPTMGVKIKKLKPQVKKCEDCSLSLSNRVVTKKLYTFPRDHWRTNCEGCGRTRNPETGLFDIDTERSQSVFISFFNRGDK